MLTQFLDRFHVIDTSRDITLLAVSLRKQYRIHIPDALIWATANTTTRY